MKDNYRYVLFIKECIDDIESFVHEGEEAFFRDKKTQYAVIRALQILAESTQRLSDELKLAYPQIDWRGIVGFRNVLVHDYFGINPVRIWEIIDTDLVVLKNVINRIIESESSNLP